MATGFGIFQDLLGRGDYLLRSSIKPRPGVLANWAEDVRAFARERLDRHPVFQILLDVSKADPVTKSMMARAVSVLEIIAEFYADYLADQ